jgi:outer membrane lipoprotein-sorting protein
MWLDKETQIPLKEEMYAKSGLLFKEMIFSDISELAGRKRPARMKMRSMEQKDAYSTVIIEEMEQKDDLPDSIFTESSLTR